MSRSLRVRIRRWHRSLGAVIALGAVFLVTTGIAINHAVQLELDQPGVQTTWILDHYGIAVDPPQSGWSVDTHWISLCAGKLYFDKHALADIPSLLGVVKLYDFTIAAAPQQLLLLDSNGTLIEQLSAADLPGRLSNIALSEQGIAVQTSAGWFTSNSELLHWSASSETPVVTQAQSLPPGLSADIAAVARSHEISWERVLLDLHSGRFFGSWGPWLIDIIALGLAALALSGLWLWLKSQPRHH